MPVALRIDADLGLLIGEASGEVTADEFIAAYSKLATDSNGVSVGMPMLFKPDEQSSPHAMDLEAIKRVGENMRSWRAALGVTKPARNAIVTRDAVRDPVPTMWQAVNDANPDVGMIVRMFAAEADALAWLAESDT